MNEHYYGLKVKLGLAEAKEEVDDILNDPIPISEQFPKEIIEHVENKSKLSRTKRLIQKSRDQIMKRPHVKTFKMPKGLNLKQINKEQKILKYNLNGLNSDIKFPKKPVDYTDPNLPL